MMPFVTGIAGVLLGGALNAMAGLILTRRTERRELAAASRALLPELMQNVETIETTLTLKRWCDVRFATDRWNQCGQRLLSGLPNSWHHVTAAYTGLVVLNLDRGIHDLDEIIDDGDDIEYLLLVEIEAKHALAIVSNLAKIPEDAAVVVPEVYGV